MYTICNAYPLWGYFFKAGVGVHIFNGVLGITLWEAWFKQWGSPLGGRMHSFERNLRVIS